MPNQNWSGEAPGRIDFLGGVADYSGSLVLQTPLQRTTRVTISPLDDLVLHFVSTQAGEWREPLDAASDFRNMPQWTRYVLGCFLLFCEATNWQREHGLRFDITSDIPIAMGVSSSAALEVATLRALESISGMSLPGTELAKMAQRVENEIVGAPCGIMDQLASTYGVHGALLPILCRPDILRAPVPLPDGVLIAGWPSGVKHAVSDSPYAAARCAAFMGKKILEAKFGCKLHYLTELTPSQAKSADESTLPAMMPGNEFIERFGEVDDVLSQIEPERVYPVRASTLFAVEENFRCELAAMLLQTINSGNRLQSTQAIGGLMYQSHAGYSAMGLGCPQTDAMVEAIRSAGEDFYGARISGGGSGGTVVVLLKQEALPKLEALRVNFNTTESILR